MKHTYIFKAFVRQPKWKQISPDHEEWNACVRPCVARAYFLAKFQVSGLSRWGRSAAQENSPNILNSRGNFSPLFFLVQVCPGGSIKRDNICRKHGCDYSPRSYHVCKYRLVWEGVLRVLARESPDDLWAGAVLAVLGSATLFPWAFVRCSLE